MTIEEMKGWGGGTLPDAIGFEILSAEPGRLRSQFVVKRELLAPHGYLHAASVVALADTSCGYGTMFDLPEGARTFTTIELKSNFTGTITEGVAECEAVRQHKGRTTQVWDATVKAQASGKTIALFRCTQIILYS